MFCALTAAASARELAQARQIATHPRVSPSASEVPVADGAAAEVPVTGAADAAVRVRRLTSTRDVAQPSSIHAQTLRQRFSDGEVHDVVVESAERSDSRRTRCGVRDKHDESHGPHSTRSTRVLRSVSYRVDPLTSQRRPRIARRNATPTRTPPPKPSSMAGTTRPVTGPSTPRAPTSTPRHFSDPS